MGLGSVRLFAKVILPASVPAIFTGIRLAAAHSILVLIAAEMVGAKAGLGYFVNAAEFNFPDLGHVCRHSVARGTGSAR
jgi:NitT/TauT family transport system permease protein